MTSADILSRVRISEVYSVLTGVKPRNTSHGCYRGPAVWRSGDNPSAVSLDDYRGGWHDFGAGESGGILDLVIKIRGGSRLDALHWVADFVGVELADRKFSEEDQQQWAEERRWLPLAQLWRRAIVRLTDELLDRHKNALFDPSLPFPEVGEIHSTEQLLTRLERIEGSELIAEFFWWKQQYPGITVALINEARRREQREQQALKRFIRAMGSPDGGQPESRH